MNVNYFVTTASHVHSSASDSIAKILTASNNKLNGKNIVYVVL